MSDIQKYKRVQTTEALEQVLKTEPSKTQFDAYLGQLDDFIAAQLAGEEYETQFPDLVAYLNTDARLADVYSRLYRLEVDAQSDNIRVREFVPKANLNFMYPIVDPLLGAIERIKGAISIDFSSELLDGLQTKTVLASSALKASESKKELYKLDLAEHGLSEWPATITVLSNENEAELCTVQVQVAPPGRAFPNLSGIEVSIEIPDLDTCDQKTNMLGVVTFDSLQIAHLSQMRVVIHE